MNYFHSIREAKDFVVSRIVEEAQREGAPLSESESKMLYVSSPGLSQAEAELCAKFERESDHDSYERKIAGLVKKADRRYRAGDRQDYDRWRSATELLSQEDHYLAVMIGQAKLRPPWDFLKLIITAILIVGVLTGGVLLLAKWGIEPPSKEAIGFWFWATMVAVAIACLLFRLAVGKDRVWYATEWLFNRIKAGRSVR